MYLTAKVLINLTDIKINRQLPITVSKNYSSIYYHEFIRNTLSE